MPVASNVFRVEPLILAILTLDFPIFRLPALSQLLLPV